MAPPPIDSTTFSLKMEFLQSNKIFLIYMAPPLLCAVFEKNLELKIETTGRFPT